MYKYLPFIILFSISCQKQVKNFEFKGIWIDKHLLGDKGTNPTAMVDTLSFFPVVLVEKEEPDSVIYYRNYKEKLNIVTHFSYNSFYTYIDMQNEIFFLPDYGTGELVYSDLKNEKFSRYVKVENSSLTREELFSPDFDLNAFIQTVK